MNRRLLRAVAIATVLCLVGCETQPTRRTPKTPTPRQVQIPPPRVSVVVPNPPQPGQPRAQSQAPPNPADDDKDGPPDPDEIPDLSKVLEPVPQDEERSKSGNPDSYEVFGKKYRVLDSSVGFRETGLASWYGRKFHGKKTSSGEPYDMFKLTAAHKTLPLPTYIRVTNLANGKSVIVKVNDRGPFHSNRILDLSFAAATKLETVGKIAMVEIEAITPGRELPPPPKPMEASVPAEVRATTGRTLQVAAYSDPINAVSMKEELISQGLGPVQIRVGQLDNGDTVHRVVVGPFEERQKMDEMRIRIRGAGYEAIPVP